MHTFHTCFMMSDGAWGGKTTGLRNHGQGATAYCHYYWIQHLGANMHLVDRAVSGFLSKWADVFLKTTGRLCLIRVSRSVVKHRS